MQAQDVTARRGALRRTKLQLVEHGSGDAFGGIVLHDVRFVRRVVAFDERTCVVHAVEAEGAGPT